MSQARRKFELALLVAFFGQQFVGGCRFGSTLGSDRGRWTWAGSLAPGAPVWSIHTIASRISRSARRGRPRRSGLDACPLCVSEFHEAAPAIVAITEYPYFPDKFE